MLTEIALTPQVFQPCKLDGNGWAGHLRALLQRLVHYGGLCPLIFSNLNDGHSSVGWLAAITSNFAAFKLAEHRTARDLFDKIKRDHLVSRPSQQQVQVAATEDQWVKEAIRPAPKHPIGKRGVGEDDWRRHEGSDEEELEGGRPRGSLPHGESERNDIREE